MTAGFCEHIVGTYFWRKAELARVLYCTLAVGVLVVVVVVVAVVVVVVDVVVIVAVVAPGLRYLETPDGRRVFYDVNANSNLRKPIGEAFGFDPFHRVADFLAEEVAKVDGSWRASAHSRSHSHSHAAAAAAAAVPPLFAAAAAAATTDAAGGN